MREIIGYTCAAILGTGALFLVGRFIAWLRDSLGEGADQIENEIAKELLIAFALAALLILIVVGAVWGLDTPS